MLLTPWGCNFFSSHEYHQPELVRAREESSFWTVSWQDEIVSEVMTGS